MFKPIALCASLLLAVGCVSNSSTQQLQSAPEIQSGSQGGTAVSKTTARQQLLEQVNQIRRSNGLSPLVRNAKLDAAAQNHAVDMAKRGYFSHTSPEGTTSAQRVKAQGYSYRVTTENIAEGYDNVPRVMAEWMKSPGHRKNILDRRVKAVGVGAGPNNKWVMVFAKPRF